MKTLRWDAVEEPKMVNPWMRNLMIVIGVAVVFVGTTGFYPETLEALKRAKEMSDYIVSALLAAAGVFHVASSVFKK